MNEEWKSVRSLKGKYEVSNLGKVRHSKTKYVRVNTLHKKHNYYAVGIRFNGVFRMIKVHRLVAEAFLRNPKHKPQVNHLDGNRLNNVLTNLEWATPLENMQHAWRTGLIPNQDHSGQKNPNSKLTDKEVIKIHAMRHKGFTAKETGKKFDLPENYVYGIWSGARWACLKDYRLKDMNRTFAEF